MTPGQYIVAEKGLRIDIGTIVDVGVVTAASVVCQVPEKGGRSFSLKMAEKCLQPYEGTVSAEIAAKVKKKQESPRQEEKTMGEAEKGLLAGSLVRRFAGIERPKE